MSLRKILIENYEYNLDIPSESITGKDFYHGTLLYKDWDYELIRNFSPQDYSDWDASWITDKEHIAETYAMRWGIEDENVPVVYKLKVNLSNVAIIDKDMVEELDYTFDLGEDLHEYITALKEIGFDGWRTLGSIGEAVYDDIAVFWTDNVEIYQAKLYLKGRWTNFYDIDRLRKEIQKRIK